MCENFFDLFCGQRGSTTILRMSADVCPLFAKTKGHFVSANALCLCSTARRPHASREYRVDLVATIAVTTSCCQVDATKCC